MTRAPLAVLTRGLVALAGALLAGCAGLPELRGEDARPPGLAPAAELLDVPFHAQTAYQCGPAALATVVGDLGIDITPEELVAEVYVPEREGTLATEMRAAARQRGLVSYPLAPDFAGLLAEIDAGYPVLVMQNLGLSWWPEWHYAVVVGYDLERERVTLRSERRRRHTIGFRTFRRTWARAERWAQVVVRPDDPPATADALTWTEAVHELEQTGRIEAARRGYRTATQTWPEFQPAWMAHGNMAWAAGEHDAARRAFRRAVDTDPDDWRGWNNLAHAAAEACPLQARAAARCAAGLAPGAEAARSTLARFADADEGPACFTLPACPAVEAP